MNINRILALEFDLANVTLEQKQSKEWRERFEKRQRELSGVNDQENVTYLERLAILRTHEEWVDQEIKQLGLLLPEKLHPIVRRSILVHARKNKQLAGMLANHAYTKRAIVMFMRAMNNWRWRKGKLDLRRCTGRTKNGKGRQCNAWAMHGRHKCRLHGGKTLIGVTHPMTKTGRYSATVPHGLSDRYEKFRAAEDLLELHEEIALLDTRTSELLQKLETGESRPGWVQARQAFERWELAMRRQDFEGAQVYVEAMRKALYRKNDSAVWAELQLVLEQRRKLVETERKRQTELEHMISVQEFLQIMHQLVWILREEVHDKDAMRRISGKITTLIHSPMKQHSNAKRIEQYEDPIEVEIETEAIPPP